MVKFQVVLTAKPHDLQWGMVVRMMAFRFFIATFSAWLFFDTSRFDRLVQFYSGIELEYATLV